MDVQRNCPIWHLDIPEPISANNARLGILDKAPRLQGLQGPHTTSRTLVDGDQFEVPPLGLRHAGARMFNHCRSPHSTALGRLGLGELGKTGVFVGLFYGCLGPIEQGAGHAVLGLKVALAFGVHLDKLPGDIHQAVLTAFGLSADSYSLNQLRYDLRKMKAHGLVPGIMVQVAPLASGAEAFVAGCGCGGRQTEFPVWSRVASATG